MQPFHSFDSHIDTPGFQLEQGAQQLGVLPPLNSIVLDLAGFGFNQLLQPRKFANTRGGSECGNLPGHSHVSFGGARYDVRKAALGLVPEFMNRLSSFDPQ